MPADDPTDTDLAGDDLPSRRDLRSKPKRRVPRWLRLTITCFVVLALLAGGAIAYGYFTLRGNIETTEVTELATPQERGSVEPLNILMIGSDAREAVDDIDGDGIPDERADSILLVHIHQGRQAISAVQIPRDTMIVAPACDNGDHPFPGGEVQINALLGYGEGCLVTAIEDMSGLELNHFVDVDFGGFADIVDAMGGVEVCLPEPLRDRRAKLDLPAGTQTIGGKDALALARTRHAVGDGSDLARLDHQKQVMSAIVQQAQADDLLSDPAKLYRFLDAVTKSVRMDDELGKTATMASLGQQMAKVDAGDIVFMSMPVGAYAPDPNRVVASQEAEIVWERLRSDERIDGKEMAEQAEPEEETAEPEAPNLADLDISESITVLNASGVSGAAAALAERLQAAGLTVGETGNATAAEQSRITYPQGQEESAKQLAAALGLPESAVRADTAGAEGFEITIGDDFPEADEDESTSETQDPAAEDADTSAVDDSAQTADGDLCG